MRTIQSQVSLQTLNTLCVNIAAPYLAPIHDLQQLKTILQIAHEEKLRPLILGQGSNIVFHHMPANTIILLMQIKGRQIIKKTSSHVYVRAYAGENWNEWIAWLVTHNIYGLENLYGIPGTVGAAPIQNCGAYGVDISHYLESVTYWNQTSQQIETRHAKSCGLSYRSSIFKQHPEWMIISIECRFPRTWQPQLHYQDLAPLREQDCLTPEDILIHIQRIRAHKFPDATKYGCAGSFFINPIISTTQYERVRALLPTLKGQMIHANRVKIPAAQLIEARGWKGQWENHVGIYEKHALILITDKQANGHSILSFAQKIQKDIKTQFDITFLIEPHIYTMDQKTNHAGFR